MKASQYKGAVPCLLDPLKDCPSGFLGKGGCPLREQARETLVKFAEEVNQPLDKGLEILRWTDNQTVEEGRKRLRLAAATNLTESGNIGECRHPEGNILRTAPYSKYDGPVPCLLDPMKDCPSECPLHGGAMGTLRQVAELINQTPALAFEILRTNVEVREKLRLATIEGLSQKGEGDKCLHLNEIRF